MKPSEILTRATDFLNTGSGCWAIYSTCCRYNVPWFVENKVLEYFRLFKPQPGDKEFGQDFWFGEPGDEDALDDRAMALIFAATIAADEGN